MPFTFERTGNTAGPTGGRLALAGSLSFTRVALRFFSQLGAGFSFFGRCQLHSRAPGLGEPNRNRLFSGPGAMLALADMVHFFADKLSSLRAGGFPLARILMSSFQSLLLGHRSSLLVAYSNAMRGRLQEVAFISGISRAAGP